MDQFGDPILHNPNIASESPKIKFVLSLGINVNIRDRKSQTVFLKLLRRDYVRRVYTWLKEPGLDVNAQDNKGFTPLHDQLSRLRIYDGLVGALACGQLCWTAGGKKKGDRTGKTLTRMWQLVSRCRMGDARFLIR